jgi:glutamate-ammonia-ligase adenylyltransferase
VLALGKLGGRELGYASDIELVFVHDARGETDGRQPVPAERFFDELVLALAGLVEAREEGAFHIDLRLRPHGRAGPPASPLAAWRAYYDGGGAAPFERQALIKLRRVAGDEELGRRVEALRDALVYDGRSWDRAASLHLRERQARELVPPGRVNVKYSPGGLIDVEYAVQYLQLQHGHEQAELRTPSTLDALGALQRCAVLSRRERARLESAYLFLRRLVEALRMVRGNARDLLLPPEDSAEFAFLARRMGHRERNWSAGARRLARQLRERMGEVRGFFDSRFGRGAPAA